VPTVEDSLARIRQRRFPRIVLAPVCARACVHVHVSVCACVCACVCAANAWLCRYMYIRIHTYT
jgi:hypothetical protein